MFRQEILDLGENIFDQLSTSTDFEDITNGRRGAILVDPTEEGRIPIVRTTTVYQQPVQIFLPIHDQIIKQIQAKCADLVDLAFNNAMIEIYNSQYRKMGFHTDQALDLKSDSYICLYSCYKHPTQDIRKLQVKNKTTQEKMEVNLVHNSVVLFSTETNSQHVHKIVLDSCKPSNNEWLGITFRLSKTFLEIREDEIPYLYPTDKILRVTDDEDEIVEFRKHKTAENKNSGPYTYPFLDYTLSISDIMKPVIK